eukprot:scaffold1988_cov255-Pinguiococcus_pyrenoidosus.AAC.16
MKFVVALQNVLENAIVYGLCLFPSLARSTRGNQPSSVLLQHRRALCLPRSRNLPTYKDSLGSMPAQEALESLGCVATLPVPPASHAKLDPPRTQPSLQVFDSPCKNALLSLC